MSYSSSVYNDIITDVKNMNFGVDKIISRKIQLNNGISMVFSINQSTLNRSLYISVGKQIGMFTTPNWKGVEISFAKLNAYDDLVYLALEQQTGSETYIFESIIDDIKTTIEKVEDEAHAINELKKVLNKWEKFFLVESSLKLSAEKEIGLIGELFFLTELIGLLGSDSINYWTGSEGEIHDFYTHKNAIEIKTTTSQMPYKVTISNVHQLDEKDVVGELFLRFYAFRKSSTDGIKIPDVIDNIRLLLAKDKNNLDKFENKLTRYGYNELGRHLYTDGFFIRDNKCFQIKGDFPRIISRDLKNGIGDLKYSIAINSCSRFEISNELLCSLILEGG